jgi:adenine-specific DNA-methyltransferase
VLDPACGEGVFVSAVRTRLADLGAKRPKCLGVDIDPAAVELSGAVCSDFFEWVRRAEAVDAVVGNPPFIRSHLFSDKSRKLAFTEMVRMGLRPSRLMSTWSPFLALCCRVLTPDGRLAMVIPEELLTVGYAEELRRFLLSRFRRVIVCLPSEGIFPGVQQATVLLLCDNQAGGPSGLLTLGYTDLEEGNFESLAPAPPWDWNSKWTHLFRKRQVKHL